MPRPLRQVSADGIYHVTARGNRRQEIFLDDGDRRRFLLQLSGEARRGEWQLFAYCLMPNHYHLVLNAPKADLSTSLQRLNGGYAQWFNELHGLDGHLFQGRFHAIEVESQWHLIELSRYLALNPVRARLCATAAEWRWSSYRTTAGLSRRDVFDPTHVLRLFAPRPAEARRRYARFVAEGVTAVTA